MKREYALASCYGEILLDNTFETAKGRYQIIIRKFNSNIYFFKYRDGKLLECQNLNIAKPKEVSTNG